MLKTNRHHTSCPECGQENLLTLAARLQSFRRGVSCHCPNCAHRWVHQDKPESLPQAENSARPHFLKPTHSGVSVFIVEDDPEIRDSLTFLLQDAGLTIKTYASAEEFLSEHIPTKPSCLLLDLNLPGMNGLELQEHLLQIGSVISVIVMSGDGDVPAVVQSFKNGAIDYFQKPCNPTAMLARIREALKFDERLQQTSGRSYGNLNNSSRSGGCAMRVG